MTNELYRAYYSNDARDTICIEWKLPESNEEEIFIREDHIPVSPVSRQLTRLLELTTFDQIAAWTAEAIRERENQMEQNVVAYARSNNLLFDSSMVNSKFFESILKVMFEPKEMTDEEEKERLFLFKLALFELNFVKNSTNKEMKAAIRKGVDMISTLKVAIELYEAETGSTTPAQ